MKNERLSKEKAEAIAAELIANEPRFRDSLLARLLPTVAMLRWMSSGWSREEPSPFVSPASPAWEVFHRNTDTTITK
jgi:hypothetical protein